MVSILENVLKLKKNKNNSKNELREKKKTSIVSKYQFV